MIERRAPHLQPARISKHGSREARNTRLCSHSLAGRRHAGLRLWPDMVHRLLARFVKRQEEGGGGVGESGQRLLCTKEPTLWRCWVSLLNAIRTDKLNPPGPCRIGGPAHLSESTDPSGETDGRANRGRRSDDRPEAVSDGGTQGHPRQ